MDFAQADFLTVQGGGADGSGTSLSTSLKDLQKLGVDGVRFTGDGTDINLSLGGGDALGGGGVGSGLFSDGLFSP